MYKRQLFDYLKPSDFRKSIALDMDGPLHDVYADVYVCRDFECEDWYVKFSIDSEGKAHLNVLSANIDGYIH